MTRSLLLVALLSLSLPATLLAQGFQLAPAVAVEAEDFVLESGWKVLQNGHGNYMVDAIGFNHISGERLLHLDAKSDKASAYLDVNTPEDGNYRLWVRYEYPAFCECRFRVQVEQGGKTIVDQVMGTKDSRRYGLGDDRPLTQHDPAWGPEGLFEEVVTIPNLKKGKTRLWLKGEPQKQTPGVSADRNIDLLYLTRDTDDAWMKHYRKTTNLYPILDAFRDTRGARWEVRLTNHGDKATDFGIAHVYNRIPWGLTEGTVARGVKPDASTDWIPLKMQDTTHFGMTTFTASAGTKFDVAIRPIGGKVERELKGAGPHRLYIPPYPGKGEQPVTPEEEIDAILKTLKETKAPGKTPTKPLCYGGWMSLGVDSDYGRKYAELYAALGFRSLHPAHSGPAMLRNLKAVGIEPSKSWAVSQYRNPPTPGNIERAKTELARAGMEKNLRFFDYGDEIAFGEWMGHVIFEEVARKKRAGETVKPAEVMAHLWITWLKKNRPDAKLDDYWRPVWGRPNDAQRRPDSSADAARENPRLYVDSLMFFEDTSIRFAAEGMKDVKRTFGDDVLCGANYSGHPFYYPPTNMYIKWFRRGAADLGRHSEYFWQVAQAGPLVNGYIAEHFRCGMRDNPKAVLRQYTMPHEPGNTDASFLRSCFTHLAHGATMLDFFGIGLNESFTENHIDHRARSRFQAIRDVTHCVGLVEDLLPEAHAVPSPVALLVSDSTERWDFAGIARDGAAHDHFGKDFRKTRLSYHMERLGLWQALTFLGVSPDLVIEEDLSDRVLKDYKVLIVVGDCLLPESARVVEKWVKSGGTLLATAGAGRYDPYRRPNETWPALLGLKGRTTEEKTTFFRPRQELPFLQPLSTIQGDGWQMPALATRERLEPVKEARTLATFTDDKSPAVIERPLGKGHVICIAALPGVASLWSALQPPVVPDRGPATHSVPTNFDKGANALLQSVLKTAAVEPIVVADPPLIDTRLLKSEKGYVLPLANYNEKVGQKVTLSIRTDAAIGKVTSAYHGELKVEKKDGRVMVTLPGLGYGDVLRLEK
jgi:hypothetical protein